MPQGTTITEAMRDVIIEPKQNADDTNINSVAWIEPHGSDDGSNAPDMPKLALRVRGSEQAGLKIKWKLTVQYRRPSQRVLAEDTVTIPATGGSSEWVTESIDGAVKIFDNTAWISAVGQQGQPLQAGRGFFGGDAELTWQLLNAAGSPLGAEEKMLFRIAGKNPDDSLCRQYIDSVANNMLSQAGGQMWYAYAIAKSETKDEGEEDSYYNQFLMRGAKHRDQKGSEGMPNWNNDGGSKPGGYGVKQVTGYDGNAMGNVPRSVIWNWQHNVDEGLRELSKVNKEAKAWMQKQRSQATVALPPHQVGKVLFKDGTSHIMEDAVAMKRYNGASKRPAPDSYTDPAGGFTFINEKPSSGHYCYWDKPRNKWSLSRYNNFSKPFIYVDRICDEVE